MKTTYTHKAWFYLCPVYTSDPDSPDFHVKVRWPLLEFWLDFNEAAVQTLQLPFKFKITGRLSEPLPQ